MQINPVIRRNTSTGKIMQEIGELVTSRGWESWVAYSRGRDGVPGPESASALKGSSAGVSKPSRFSLKSS